MSPEDCWRKMQVRKTIGTMNSAPINAKRAGIDRRTLMKFNTNAISRLAENTSRRMQAGGMKPLNLA